MSIKDVLAVRKELSLLFIDPGNGCTGWANFLCTRLPTGLDSEPYHYKSSLANHGKLKPPGSESEFIDEGRTLQTRIDWVCSRLESLSKLYKVRKVFIELPAVVYGAGRISRKEALSKGQSLIKLAALAFSLRKHLENNGFSCREILPSQWQVHHTKRKGQTSKQWSLSMANEILSENMFLHTKDDENVADAITMGRMIFPKLLDETVCYGR